MANIGLTNLWYSHLTELSDGTAQYDGAKSMGKAVSCTVSVNNNDAKLYGDDTLAESDTTVSGGTITIGTTDDDDTIFADMLGHSVVDGVVVSNINDVAPYIGVGRIITKIVNGVYKYKGVFIKKAKMSEPAAENNTKGESVEFSTPSVEGMFSALKNGEWRATKTFSTQADALTWLKNLMAAPGTTYRITYDLMGGTGSVDDVSVNAGSSAVLEDGTNITAPEGKTFLGWATNTAATTPNVTSPYTPSEDVTLYAVYENAE